MSRDCVIQSNQYIHTEALSFPDDIAQGYNVRSRILEFPGVNFSDRSYAHKCHSDFIVHFLRLQ